MYPKNIYLQTYVSVCHSGTDYNEKSSWNICHHEYTFKVIKHSTKHALSFLGTQDVKDSGTGLQDTCTLMG